MSQLTSHHLTPGWSLPPPFVRSILLLHGCLFSPPPPPVVRCILAPPVRSFRSLPPGCSFHPRSRSPFPCSFVPFSSPRSFSSLPTRLLVPSSPLPPPIGSLFRRPPPRSFVPSPPRSCSLHVPLSALVVRSIRKGKEDLTTSPNRLFQPELTLRVQISGSEAGNVRLAISKYS